MTYDDDDLVPTPDGPVPGCPGWRFTQIDREHVWADSLDGRDEGWYTTFDVHDATPGVGRSIHLVRRRRDRFLTDAEVVAIARDAITRL